MATLPNPYISPEEYLAIERKAEFKSEYYDGAMFAMAGAQRQHNGIAANLYAELGAQLRGTSCRYYPSEMRVRTTGVHYCYPDASVVCGQPEFLDSEVDTLLNPVVIVEVLSPTTEAYDRGKKFELYQQIPSLRAYLLLASDRMHADLYVRQANGSWLLQPYSNPEDILRIEFIGCSLKLADLYDRVEF
jgi:Uma2 family endonuclease